MATGTARPSQNEFLRAITVKYSDALQGIGRVTNVTNLMERAGAGGKAEHPHPVVGKRQGKLPDLRKSYFAVLMFVKNTVVFFTVSMPSRSPGFRVPLPPPAASLSPVC